MNILMINLPFSGHTNPTLPLTRALVERGHAVTCINAGSFRGKIEGTGARFVPYRDFPADLSEAAVKRRCFRAAFETALALEGPFDLLIYEMFFYPGIDVARCMGVPCVRQFSQPAWSWETWRAAPPVFRASAKLIDAQVLPKATARRMGLTYACLRDGVIESRPALNIVYVPEPFQGCRESFDGKYLFMVPPQAARGGGREIPFDEMKPPVVYISLGSIISNRGFCRECLRAFGGTEFSVILNTGKVPPDSLGPIPENIRAYGFVPQVEVLGHADVFLTHCGMNSVNESLSAGVPMVAMPFINDQLTNARRIVELGLGRRVRSFPSRGRELLRAVREVNADAAIRENVRRMRDSFKNQPGWDEIIGRLEAIITENRS